MNISPNFADNVVAPILNLVLALFPLVLVLILIAFAWGVIKFILKAGDVKAQQEGKDLLKWGLIALFVAFALYGILSFLYAQFGFQQSGHGFVIPTLREGAH